MKVTDITVEYVNHMGNDIAVANAARVSFAKDATNYTEEQNNKLIQYLAKNKHFSPFNHTFLSFRVKAPIFVSRQLVKHKFMPWNEVSRRYVDSEPEFFDIQFRWAAENVKQGSGAVVDALSQAKAENIFWESIDAALAAYTELLEMGICAEQARAVLPVNQHTEWIWSGTLGAFADMLRLRLDPHTQAESRIVAELIKAEVEKLFPVSTKALLENNGN